MLAAGERGWEPRQALGGHYGPVVDLSWGLDGSCLFSASEDQTTRACSEFLGRWCEIARPQVGWGGEPWRPSPSL